MSLQRNSSETDGSISIEIPFSCICTLELVVIGVERKIILFTPLPDSKAAGFLICKSDGPFLKMDLMKFLSCIHEMILLDKVTRIAQIERIVRIHV